MTGNRRPGLGEPDDFITAGVDVGSSAVKVALLRLGSNDRAGVLSLRSERIDRKSVV